MNRISLSIKVRRSSWWTEWVNPGKATIERAKIGIPEYKIFPRKCTGVKATARSEMKRLWKIHRNKDIENRDMPIDMPIK